MVETGLDVSPLITVIFFLADFTVSDRGGGLNLCQPVVSTYRHEMDE